jgi:Ni/Fe-hydrogenase subunit HybB-like protein
MKSYLNFLHRCFRNALSGSWRYHAWLAVLFVLMMLGLNAWCRQYVYGMGTTGMTDQVSWGIYIANFTFLVGVAASAVMLVIPVYVYKRKELHHLVIFGELLAVAAIIMCLLFIVADLGRPDQMHHMLLRFNFPISVLTWDVIALNGYLLLNLFIPGYMVYCTYRKKEQTKSFIYPFVFISIFWALSIHTVTAFLYSGLGGRPFWNSAVLAPRFLASAFAAGPAILILTLQVIRRQVDWKVEHHSLLTLRSIVIVTMFINLFLLGSEVFTEFYTRSAHVASAQYLFLGLHGHNALVPWIWTAIGLNVTATLLLLLPASKGKNPLVLNTACVMLIIGIWIEKGMGLIIPGFIPTPLGEIVEYLPTLNESLVCFGIWATGIFIYTVLVRVTIPVLNGELTEEEPPAKPARTPTKDNPASAT